MASELLKEHDLVHHKSDHDHVETDHLWDGGVEPFKASYGKLMMWYFLLSDAFTFAGFLIAYGTLRMSMPAWPLPDYVFRSFPFTHSHMPLMFVSVMTFVLIVSSVTMVRAVQEGHKGNKRGVVFWMLLTIVGGAIFLGSQAWEWTTLIKGENVSVTQNPFGQHTNSGTYTMNEEGEPYKAGEKAEIFKKGEGYLLEPVKNEAGEIQYNEAGQKKFIERSYKTVEGKEGKLVEGPTAFGALFFFITGFHGFHVFSGVIFLVIIMLNVASGLYERRGNHYEMVEKIGLYWHFVDLVWVFVFLVFYLL
jgi:cytochrome c oxidase subunit III